MAAYFSQEALFEWLYVHRRVCFVFIFCNRKAAGEFDQCHLTPHSTSTENLVALVVRHSHYSNTARRRVTVNSPYIYIYTNMENCMQLCAVFIFLIALCLIVCHKLDTKIDCCCMMIDHSVQVMIFCSFVKCHSHGHTTYTHAWGAVTSSKSKRRRRLHITFWCDYFYANILAYIRHHHNSHTLT